MHVASLPAGAMAAAVGRAFSERHNVTFGFRSTEKTQKFLETRQIDGLPETIFSADIGATENLWNLARESDVLILGTPMRHLMTFASGVLPYRRESGIVVCVPKGIEKGTNRTPFEVVKYVDPDAAKRTLVLSGPNFAHEIAKGLPALTVVASEDLSLAERFAQEFSTSRFRIYPSDDVIGVGLAGALKNVIAIAAGICDGRKMGESARTGLLTRGGAEVRRLGMALGGKELTFNGLAGVGDLFMTGASKESRNHKAGVQIAKGRDPKKLMNSKKTIEGLHTAGPAASLAEGLGIDTPIIQALNQVINKGLSVEEAIGQLLSRDVVYEDGMPLRYY